MKVMYGHMCHHIKVNIYSYWPNSTHLVISFVNAWTTELHLVFKQNQSKKTEKHIKEEFTKLHQFLRDEEEAALAALRQEEDQKSQMMKEKLEKINGQISALSDIIKDLEEKMKVSDVSLLQVRTEC